MTTGLWILVALLAFDAVSNILTIGKRREPRTPFEGLCGAAFIGLIIWAIIDLASA